jgi:hypothetical protein
LKEYKNYSFLPNVNPICPQLEPELPIVRRDQIGVPENIIGLNLNNYWPKHEATPTGGEEVFKLESTYA